MLLGMLLLISCLYSLLARDTYQADFRAYYVAAQTAHDGLDPYVNQVNVDEKYADRDWLEVNSRFIYPPSSLFLFAPLAHLPYRSAKVLFAVGNALLMAGLLFFLSGRFPRASWAAAGLFLSLPMAANVDNGQVDILILVLTLAAFYIRRPLLAGGLLGVAIAIKLSPALVLLWFVVDRRWMTAAWATLVSLTLAAGAAAVWGVSLWRESLRHLTVHLSADAARLTHVFREFPTLYGRFVVMGSNSYALHYYFGTRQNPLLWLGKAAGAAGLALVVAYLLYLAIGKPRWARDRTHGREASFYAFLVVALFANALLWPAGLVACFPLTLLLVQRARDRVSTALLLLTPFFLPLEIFADHRFLLWLAAAAWSLWRLRRGAHHSVGEHLEKEGQEQVGALVAAA